MVRPWLAAVVALVAWQMLPWLSGNSSTFAGEIDDCAACTVTVETEPQIERGRSHTVVDALGWVWGIPAKIALWDRRAENHKVSSFTELKVAEYVAANGLTDTKIRINQYDPGGEWRRLADNKHVGAGWRYTVGAFYTLGYTLFPGRVFGRDAYNPYTDSVYVYSDIPALALEQAAHAKNVKQREHPGTYAAAFSLPVLTLVPEKIAKDDVLAYIQWEGDPIEQVEAIEVLYPQYGSEIGGQIAGFEPLGGSLWSLAGAGVGHIVGHVKSRDVSVPSEATTGLATVDFDEQAPAFDGEVELASAIR